MLSSGGFGEEESAESLFEKGMNRRKNYYPYSAQRMFQRLLVNYPQHPISMEAQSQLILLKFDLSMMQDYLEESEDFMKKNEKLTCASEMALDRIKAWIYLKKSEDARKEICQFREKFPESSFIKDLPLLELKSYFIKGDTDAVKNNVALQKRCEELFRKALANARRKNNMSQYESALNLGARLSEITNKKDNYYSIMEKEKILVPKKFRSILHQQTLLAKGKMKIIEHVPDTPAQLLHNVSTKTMDNK